MLGFAAMLLSVGSIGSFVFLHQWVSDFSSSAVSFDSLSALAPIFAFLIVNIAVQLLETTLVAWFSSEEPLESKAPFSRTLPTQVVIGVTQFLIAVGFLAAFSTHPASLIFSTLALSVALWPAMRAVASGYWNAPRIVDENGNFLSSKLRSLTVPVAAIFLATGGLLAVATVGIGVLWVPGFGSSVLGDLFLWMFVALRLVPIAAMPLTLAVRHHIFSRAQAGKKTLKTTVEKNNSGMSSTKRLVVFLGLKGQFLGLDKHSLGMVLKQQFPEFEVILIYEPFHQWDSPLRQSGALARSQKVLRRVHRGADRVEYLGVSVGAFAAIIHARLLKPARVTALMPPSVITDFSWHGDKNLPDNRLSNLEKMRFAPQNLRLMGSVFPRVEKSKRHNCGHQKRIAKALDIEAVIFDEDPVDLIRQDNFLRDFESQRSAT
jgi:hypothetical protein